MYYAYAHITGNGKSCISTEYALLSKYKMVAVSRFRGLSVWGIDNWSGKEILPRLIW